MKNNNNTWYSYNWKQLIIRIWNEKYYSIRQNSKKWCYWNYLKHERVLLSHEIRLLTALLKPSIFSCKINAIFMYIDLMLLFLCTNFFSLVQISMSITCHFILFAKSIAFPRHFWHEYLTPSLSSCWCRIILLGIENFRVVIIRLT